MKRTFHKQILSILVVTPLLFVISQENCLSEERETVRAIPVYQAKPVEHHTALGKLLGKTMNTVSHTGSTLFPKMSKSAESTDKGAPEVEKKGLFDPSRHESPIRTARLFSIQINPPVAQAVAVPAE